MNWPYIHILINHFPVIFSVAGCLGVLAGLISRNRGVWLYGLASQTFAGITIYPTYFSGDQAGDALHGAWYIVRGSIGEHDDAAGFALAALLITGVASAYAWWRMLRRERGGLPPVWLRWVVTVLSVWALSVVVRTAYLGGKIVHDSPKLLNPPAGVGALI